MCNWECCKVHVRFAVFLVRGPGNIINIGKLKSKIGIEDLFDLARCGINGHDAAIIVNCRPEGAGCGKVNEAVVIVSAVWTWNCRGSCEVGNFLGDEV